MVCGTAMVNGWMLMSSSPFVRCVELQRELLSCAAPSSKIMALPLRDEVDRGILTVVRLYRRILPMSRFLSMVRYKGV
jgi:hypothetical protein